MTILDHPQTCLLCVALDRIDALSRTVDQLIAICDRQDTALTELESRLLDMEQAGQLALHLSTNRHAPAAE